MDKKRAIMEKFDDACKEYAKQVEKLSVRMENRRMLLEKCPDEIVIELMGDMVSVMDEINDALEIANNHLHRTSD